MSFPFVSGNISGQRYQITVSIQRRRDRDPVAGGAQDSVRDVSPSLTPLRRARACQKCAVALPRNPWLASATAIQNRQQDGETSHDRTTDAPRRLENDVSVVSVHAGELCRQ